MSKGKYEPFLSIRLREKCFLLGNTLLIHCRIQDSRNGNITNFERALASQECERLAVIRGIFCCNLDHHFSLGNTKPLRSPSALLFLEVLMGKRISILLHVVFCSILICIMHDSCHHIPIDTHSLSHFCLRCDCSSEHNSSSFSESNLSLTSSSYPRLFLCYPASNNS